MDWKILAISILVNSATCYAESCVPRDYGYGSTVCVCNSTYCDTVEAPTEEQITGGSVRHYVTSKAGKRLQPMTVKFSNSFRKRGPCWIQSLAKHTLRTVMQLLKTPRITTFLTLNQLRALAHNLVRKGIAWIPGLPRETLLGFLQQVKSLRITPGLTLGGLRALVRNLAGDTSVSRGNQATFKVNRQVYYQTMLGFGGAITDACGLNTYSLSTESSEKLIRSYFSEEGIGYTFLRVPVAGSDFSTRKYTYDDEHPNDTTLKYFNLTAEDFLYKIPFIKKAQEISPNKVRLFSSPWSAPDWMKNISIRTLKEEYYQVFADYYIKFLDAYAAEGLKFWGLTPQNEPTTGALPFIFYNAMAWTPSQMLEYLAGNLCPSLKSNGYKDLKVMISDDQRSHINDWVQLYNNEIVWECVSGMALHWYDDLIYPANILTQAHEQYPDKFLLYTEASVLWENGSAPVQLGNWTRGVLYMSDIIEVTNNWVTGWVDWNMALGVDGGPNWANGLVEAPLITNTTADEFYKQPMFYAIAHFSKFVPPGSVRIGLETEKDGGLENVAFLTPGRAIVVILHNINDYETDAVISDPDKGSLLLKIPANSMNTIIYK